MQTVLDASRRLSTLTELCPPPKQERRPSMQDMADSAMSFLEKRRSSDQSIGAGCIEPSLYRKRGSVVRNESTSGSPPVGSCDIQMKYDFSRSDFHITVKDVRNISGVSQYFMRVRVSGCSQVFQTEKTSCGCPFRKEHFKFPVSYEQLMQNSLSIQLIATTNTGRGTRPIGEVLIKLASIDPSDEVMLSTDIDMINAVDNLGSVFLGLQYLPSASRLTVTLHQAKDLLSLDSLPNAYVKMYLVDKGKLLKKKKSVVRKNSQCPVWNEALSFSLPPSQLATAQLEMDVLDYDRLGNDKLLGQISMSGGGWDKMWKDVSEGKTVNPRWIALRFL